MLSKEGEWLKYTLNFTKAGNYNVSAKLSSDHPSKLSVILGNKTITTPIKESVRETWVMLGKFNFKKGINTIMIKAAAGGLEFHQLKFD